VADINNSTPGLEIRAFLLFFKLFAPRPGMRDVASFLNLETGRLTVSA